MMKMYQSLLNWYAGEGDRATAGEMVELGGVKLLHLAK